MSSLIKLQQRLAELSRQLTNNDLNEEERLDIESEIEEIEDQMDDEINRHDGEEDY